MSAPSLDRNAATELGNHVATAILARRLPKAELHLHLEGSLSPTTLSVLRGRRGLTTDLETIASHFDYVGMDEFFDGLSRTTHDLLDPDGLEFAVSAAVRDSARSGVRHLEMFYTPGQTGRDLQEQRSCLDSVARTFQRDAGLLGMTGGVIVEMYRPGGAEASVQAAQLAIEAAAAGLPIVGVGNDGDYQHVAVSELEPGYVLAREAGLRRTAHADVPDDVTDALALDLDRIDHAFDLEHDGHALAEIVRRQTPLTVCVTSNCVMIPDRFPDVSAHPLSRFIEAGVTVALGTDDPPHFFTDLAQEYALVATALGWSASELADAAMASLRAAWIPEDMRSRRLAAWQLEADRLVRDCRVSSALEARG